MGNSLRVDSTNNVPIREVINQSYDKTHGIEAEPSIWEHFSPMAMGGAVAFPLLFNSKEFKYVKLADGLSKQELYKNKYRMIRANELEHGASLLKLPKTTLSSGKKVVDPFMQSEIINFQNDVRQLKNSGQLSKDAFSALNKKYFEIADKTLTWKSPVSKILMKGAKLAPNTIGEFAKAFKNNKCMIIFDALFEIPEVLSAFTTPEPGKLSTGINIEAGTKQLVKSTGRVAVGYTGFAAGTALGLKIGSMLGSVIPGAGTVMGGIIGSAIGFAVGGVVSQLAKGAYNNIIPDTKTVAKETTIASILDSSDTTETSKTIIQTELANAKEKLAILDSQISNAEKAGDETALKEAQNDKEAVEKGYYAMNEIYQKKFGEKVIEEAKDESSQQSSAPINTSALPTQNYAQTNGFYNPMQTQFANQMMSTSPQTDWSSLLPVNVQQNMFAA